jgi:hypothetical protein
MQILRQTRQRHPRWQADATYRRLLREQVWWERRQRMRSEVSRHWTERPRLEPRRLWTERPRLELRRHWTERPRPELRRHWTERPRPEPHRHWTAPPRLAWHPGRGVRRAAVVTLVLLLGGVAGHGSATTGQPSAMGADRSANRSAGVQRPAPGLPRTGIFLSVAINDQGKLQAVERARTGTPVTELSLIPPPPPPGSRELPKLQRVRLFADGEQVSLPTTTVEVTTVVPLTDPATRFELRYQVVGAAARSKPTARGRATLSLRPALVPTLKGSSAVIAVQGAKVHNLVCVDRPREKQLCGVDRGEGWRTRPVPSASATVIALVDLPDRVS